MTASFYRLAGAINPRGEGPAICVPAFNCSDDNYTYTQRIGVEETVLSFELADRSDWELVSGAPKARQVTIGDPAIYWVTWTSDQRDPVFGNIDVVRKAVIDNRWIIDTVANPFERLDFAQLSGQYRWFAAEAKVCEAAFEAPAREYWLRETLCLSRVRFAVDAVLLARDVPLSTRKRIAINVESPGIEAVLGDLKALCRRYLKDHSREAIAGLVEQFLKSDIAYRYAISQLSSTSEERTATSFAAIWYKKITRSDAQRKRSGNQRGGITLVKAGFPVNTQTYFRQELFADLDWVPGKTRTTNKDVETASVRMRTNVLGHDLGTLSFSASYAPNRVAAQNNYTTLLHLGPLSQVFARQNMTNKWLAISRADDGSFSLAITDKSPT